MKILHIIPSVSSIRGGTSTAILETVRALCSLDISAEIVTTNDNGDDLLDVPINELIEYKGVPVRFFSRFSPPIHGISEYAFSLDFTQWIYGNIENYNLVEIHSFFSYVCSFSAMIARWKSIPYIINPHGQLLPWVIAQKRLKKNIYTLLIERQNLNNSAAIRCTSIQEEQNVRDFRITAPTFILPIGVQFPDLVFDSKSSLRRKYNLSRSSKIILFVSRFHPKKRLDFLLKVLKKIEGYRNFYAIFAGSGEVDYVQYIEKLIISLGLEDRVILTGFVTGIEKKLLFQGADIFALPTFGENFGMSIVEAMAYGLPIVTTPEAQISSDIIIENAGLVVPGEQDKWVKAMEQLLSSSELREQMGENGTTLFKRKFASDIVNPKLATVYRSIINKNIL